LKSRFQILLLAVLLKAAPAFAGLPAGWGDADIGSPGVVGSATYTNGVWTVAGGGADIWNNGDQFHFLTNSLNGDGAVIARVISQTATDPWAQAGIMIRNDISSNAPQASLLLTPGNGVTFRYRSAAGGPTVQTFQTGVLVPEWIRLSRSNNVFTAAYSANGTGWTQLATQTVAMANPVLAGLAVTAHNNSLISTGAFTSLLVVPGPQAGTQTNLNNPYIGGLDMAWQTTWPLPQLNVASNAPTPRMGWNSWFVVGDATGPSETLIKATADALATNGLAAAGYKYEVIDCSWIASGRGYRATNGDLMVTNTYWPDGMKAVADYVHADGLFMGGYSDIGSPGYGGPAQIGMYANYQHDADQFAAWGWDFIKIDDHGPGDFYAACHAIANNASGRPMVISLSTPQVDRMFFGPRIANSYRVNNDIAAPDTTTVSWSSILWEFDTAQGDWYAQAPGHWLDPDMLMVGFGGISDLEGRSQMNLWCILSAPLMIGTDVRTGGTKYFPPYLTTNTLSTLTNAEVIAVDQDALGSVGRPVAGGTAVYAKPLGGFTSGQLAVLLLNRSGSAANLTVNWSDLGLVAGSSATVRDLWAHQDLGSFTGGYTATNVPAHGSVMLKVSGVFNWNLPRTYEAESAYNSFSGTAYYVPHNANFSATAYVTGVGSGAANALQFNHVAAPSNGLYEADIYYACGVNRAAQMSVNGGTVTNLSFIATGGDTNQVGALAVYVPLLAGENTLTFGNLTNLAPNLDKVVVSSGSPTGLQAVAGDGRVNLSWSAVATGATFNLYRGTNSGGETFLAGGLATTNFTDPTVTNGTIYFYTVTANNPALGGESPPSGEVSARPRYATSSLAYSLAVVSNSPYAYWRLNETNGTIAADSIGGYNGAYGSAVALGVAGPRPPDFLGFEITNTAAQFTNGAANSWITIPALNLNTNTVTVTAWIYPLGSQVAYAGLVFCRSGSTVAGMNIDGTGAGLGYTWNNNSSTWGWSSGVPPPAKQWSFVALVVQPAGITLYLLNTNGQQAATNSVANPNQAFAGTGTIGTDTYASAARVFNGVIDEVAVFNDALTPAQIQQLYANGHQLTPVQVGLQPAGNGLQLTWPQGTLMQAPAVNGPWSAVPGIFSQTNVSPTNSAMFYRILLQ
jgi:alpha-galactosidase